MSDIDERLRKLSPEQLAVLVRRLGARVEELERNQSAAAPAANEPIAIVGLACRFPGAPTAAAYWDLLRNGVDAIREVPRDRWDIDAFYDTDPNAPGKMTTRWGGFVDHIDQFDAAFFGIAPREAERMDPQQRLLLEVAWHALEDAAIPADSLRGRPAGVFMGLCNSDYAYQAAFADRMQIDAYGATGNAHSVAAGRLSYILGLQGPSLSIDTACSSSLIAVHLACQSLARRECELALVGGVSVMVAPEMTIAFSKARMMSADGRCKTFDAAADGYVRGEGCGVVVLKRLSDAIAAGDHIRAVVRGTAVNQDGKSSGLTAPNERAQAAVIRAALAAAGVTPDAIQYVEAHGTGTPLGDPIELRALGEALGRARAQGQPPLVVGSVKTNIGHLEAAAGVAALIKVVLCLEHEEIAPHLHLHHVNPHISLADARVAIPTARQAWKPGAAPRLAGVSSFGFSGTNGHLIVGEAPAPAPVARIADERPFHVLAVSARTPGALDTLRGELAVMLDDDASVGDVCFTANAGRSHGRERLAFVVGSTEELIERLAAEGEAPGVFRGSAERDDGAPLAFLFTGQGAQYAGMGKALYASQPTFRRTLDQCADVLRGELEHPLLDVMFGGDPALLDHTAYTQPALFALEAALYELWRSWGVRPQVVLGHSVGEYVAAWAAGVFSLEDGLRLIAARGRLMGALPAGGAMAALFTDVDRVTAALREVSDQVAIGAVNGPANVIISGAAGAVEAVIARLAKDGVTSQQLRVSHAFHSPLMEPILDEFTAHAARIKYAPPSLALISNVTGAVATADEVTSPAYWRRHLRAPVQFAAGIAAIQGHGVERFLEIGPHPTLLAMARRCFGDGGLWLPSLRRNRDDSLQLAESVAQLYVAGGRIDWAGFDRDFPRRKIALPAYPFERERYWADLRASSPAARVDVWSPAVQAARAEAERGVDPATLAALPAQTAALDRWCHALMTRALAELGAFAAPHTPATAEEWRARLGILPTHAQLLRRWLDMLTGAGKFARHGDTYTAIGAGHDDLAAIAADAAQRNADSPQMLRLGQRCGDHLAAMLRGQEDPRGLLFPDGSFEIAEGMYQEGPAPRYFNQILREALTAIIAALPGDRMLRVLEIGGGTGGTTSWVLPVLPAARTRYVFTDVSRLFLKRAEDKFEAFPFLETHLFDLERTPASQGLALGEYDLIFASNVVHATRDLDAALDHARSLLAPGGMLLMYEMTRPSPFFDISFGALMTALTDDRARDAQPFLSAPAWAEALRRHGFVETAAVPATAVGDVIGQHVVLARAAGDGAFAHRIASVGAAADEAATGPADPVLGRRKAGAIDVFERALVADGELGDHRVHGRVVVPAAGLVELAAAAAGARVQAIEVREPLVIEPDAARKVQLVVTGREAGERIKIFADADGGWRLHAIAEIGAPRPGASEPLADVQARCTTAVEPAAFYARVAALGLAYGPAFQRIEELRVGDGEALARLRGDASRALAGPVLDAAFQVLGAALAPALHGADEVYMPVAIEHVERFRDAADTLFVHARLRNRASLPELAVGDLWIVDAAGAPVARVLGLSLRRAPRAALLRMLGHSVDASLYQLRWQADDAPLAARARTGERWLVVGDGRGLAGALAARLRTAGATVDVLAADAALPDGPIDGVVHLAGIDQPDDLDAATGLDLVAAQRQSCGSLLTWIQALARRGAATRLRVVTRGAQPVDDAPLAIAQAALAGLCRTAMLEHPELAIACLDLDPGTSLDDAADQLVLGLASDDQHTAFRAGKRFVHRLARKEQARQRLVRPAGDNFRLASKHKGTLDALTLAAADRRPPGPGEVEITVHAAGLNFLDVMDALGVLPFERGGFGNECAGTIAAVGPGVTRFRVGDPVVAVGPGGMARFATFPLDLVAPKPAALPFHHAAGAPIILMTVERALGEVADLQPGQSVLVHAAAGGVGLAAVRWAQRRGA
ncbi:MAG TPA: beta-ketoacyl synthase N-terminal-like domain-containing protein, partial [Kofleriaceae bacterium]|nr:beta-ketoacyl synthase N-terminal-like domain-containing protein [Kofleriaceae bacterium]